ncbi:MAG: DUF3634 family protein [Myxococcales bacterium]|nr:DUF3634 family protein [Myxococcales bacterium]
MSLLIPIALLILSIPLVVALVRINELFVVEVRKGEARPLRGRIPQGLLDDIVDIARRLEVEHALIRAVSEDGRAAIYVHGKALPRGLRQRLRNTISQYPLAKIRSAPKAR